MRKTRFGSLKKAKEFETKVKSTVKKAKDNFMTNVKSVTSAPMKRRKGRFSK